MAGNFKPMYWSQYCETELKKELVLANWCDYKFEGEITAGARLKIVGATRPTIQKYVAGKDLEIENLGDNSQYLDITESDAFFTVIADLCWIQITQITFSAFNTFAIIQNTLFSAHRVTPLLNHFCIIIPRI